MIRLSLFAPAKVNLDLTITGKREDGYHTLHSHVAFADIGDEIALRCEDSDETRVTCTVSGEFAASLQELDPLDNLAVRAARQFLKQHNLSQKIHIDLVKHIPPRAGLGGGSADAAALWRGLNQAFGKGEPAPLSLGADVPVCYHAEPCVMEGVGELLSPRRMPQQHAVLIWPGPGASTKELYDDFDASPPFPQHPSGNAFQDAATRRCPAIGDALMALRAVPGCLKAQLSGSGSAVFGLFDEPYPKVPTLPFPWVRSCNLGPVLKPLVTERR